LLSRNIGGQITTYHSDVLGNLISVTLPDSTTIEYVIDGQNRRVAKKVNGVQTKGFLYSHLPNPVAELDISNNIVSRFIYGNRTNVPEYMIKGGITYRIISDYLGSPRLVVNTLTGSIAQRMEYDEFGQVVLDTSEGFQPFGFSGGLYDSATGLVRLGFRDYDSQIGRWTIKDPISFQGGTTNLYEYCHNDPINLVDIWGLEGAESSGPSTLDVINTGASVVGVAADAGQGIADTLTGSQALGDKFGPAGEVTNWIGVAFASADLANTFGEYGGGETSDYEFALDFWHDTGMLGNNLLGFIPGGGSVISGGISAVEAGSSDYFVGLWKGLSGGSPSGKRIQLRSTIPYDGSGVDPNLYIH
jgi:RHS repeat-associated protein